MRVRETALVLLPVLPFLVGWGVHQQAPERSAEELCRFHDPEITESSGLVAGSDWLATVNDSGDAARVFVLDRECRTVGEVTWADAAVDVEGLAPEGDDVVWVGDIGDNLRRRDHVTVARVPLDGGDTATYRLTWPHGARDAEALLRHPVTGRLVVVSKAVIGGRVHVAPRRLDPDGPNRLRARGSAVLSLTTDGAFLPDGRHLVLRNYTTAAVFTWPGLDRVATFPLPRQDQGEALAVDGDDLLLSSEGVAAPVLRMALPDDALAAVATPTPTPTSTPTPSVTFAPSATPTVPAGAEAPPAGDTTGPDVGQVAAVGAGLLAVGALLWVVIRRRDAAGRPPG